MKLIQMQVLQEAIITLCGHKEISEIKTKRDVERFMNYVGMDSIDELNKERLNEDDINDVYNSIRTLLENKLVEDVPF
jgi:hypothetical protein